MNENDPLRGDASSTSLARSRRPWNKGKVTGPKPLWSKNHLTFQRALGQTRLHRRCVKSQPSMQCRRARDPGRVLARQRSPHTRRSE
jgi:hypothetical protein